MSDPAQNVEIEDVLSSIRRLVSESGGMKAEARKPAPSQESSVVAEPVPEPVSEPAPEPEPKSAALDKLVLTPALRVAEEPEESHAPEAEAEEAEAADLGAEEDSTPENAEAEAQAEAPAEPEADEAHAEAAEPADAPVDDTAEAGSSLKDRIEQLEAAVSTQDGGWEEEETGEALPWEDHAEPQEAPFVASETLRAEADTNAEEADEDDVFDFMAGDEALLDEETLREMVADIVRQELQGALGERITRNVRKLVRREIHRALMAQELE